MYFIISCIYVINSEDERWPFQQIVIKKLDIHEQEYKKSKNQNKCVTYIKLAQNIYDV